MRNIFAVSLCGTLTITACNGGGERIGLVTEIRDGTILGKVTDIDGNTYNTIQIGSQKWMQENLKTTKYNNGDLIHTNLSDSQWEGIKQGAWAYYKDSNQYNNIYGKLYNWYAVSDPRGLCPTGWHVPTDSEWNVLVKHLDSQADTTGINFEQSKIAGGFMKTLGDLNSGIGQWHYPNQGASNRSGFTGLPGGLRLSDGFYFYIGSYSYYWSTSEGGPDFAWGRDLNSNAAHIYRNGAPKQVGSSVRCLMD